MQLFRFLLTLPLIVACTQQDVPDASRSAQFDSYPNRLFETFESSCSGPGETFQTHGGGGFECIEFLPPEAAAFLILNYNGYPQELPKSVMRLIPTKTTDGYRVDASLVFKVPQKNGSTVEVPVESTDLDKTMSTLYRALGGSPT